MKVYVYYNLHKKCFSIKALSGTYKGLVFYHSDTVLLNDVTFKVSQAGRQRVLNEHRKNVHAGVTGTLVAYSNNLTDDIKTVFTSLTTEITYDPYKYNSFVHKPCVCSRCELKVTYPLQPAFTAKHAYMSNKRIFI